MSSDIAQCGRAEQRVRHSMGQRVTVGMPCGTFVEGNSHAAKNQRTAGHETVDIVAEADAKLRFKAQSRNWKARRLGYRTGADRSWLILLWILNLQLLTFNT